MSKQPAVPEGAGAIPIPKSRRGLKGFFAEVSREMKKVSWPPKQETTRLTGVVMAVCGLIICLLVVFNLTWGWVVELLTKGF